MAWADTKLAAALAKIVLSRAVPTEPPTCWEVLTMAEAMPASWLLTPSVAVEKAGAKMQPIPTPVSSRPGSTWLDVRAVRREPGEQDHRDDPERHAGHDQRLGAGAGQNPGLHGGGREDDHHGHGQEGQAGLQGRVAEVLLHVIGEEQEDGEHRRAGERDRRVGASAGPIPDDVQRQQRMLDAPLERDEPDQQHGAQPRAR